MKRTALFGILGVVIASLIIFSGSAWAVPVTLRVVDQYGADIPGSVIDAHIGYAIYNGEVVDLPEGPRQFEILPGRNGATGRWDTVYRTEMREILTSTTFLNFVWITSEVTFDVVDQNSSSIPGSYVFIYTVGGQGGSTPFTITVPVTDRSVYPTMAGDEAGIGYLLNVQPGLPVGNSNWTILERTGEHLPVSVSTSSAIWEWTTSAVTIDVVDQNGNSIPGSYVEIPAIASGSTPFKITLPITDQVYPNMTGGAVGVGYALNVQPGLNGGNSNWTVLERTAEHFQVHASTTAGNFQWATSQVTLDVVDQNGDPISGSYISIHAIGAGYTPFTISVPITKQIYPNMIGDAVGVGYPVSIYPGLNGLRWHYFLERPDVRMQVSVSTSSAAFEWISDECPVAVVDSSGNKVNGSTFSLEGVTYSNGDLLHLPITDNSTYSNIQGAFADGYLITLHPGDNTQSSETYQFEALPGGRFSPDWVTIDGKSYGLRCGLNQPPVAEAGNNLAILSAAQNSTLIIGKASDPDLGDHLTYRWLEGNKELLTWQSVQSDGTCPLDLGTLPPFSLVDHTLILEVTDGQATASDRMNLEIDHSPPTISCAGSITVPVWSPFALNGSVADFDGNPVSWMWQEGAATYGAGTAYPDAGGASTPLPVVTLSNGLSLGQHLLTLTATDGFTSTKPCTLQVNVIDTKAPTMAPVATPSILWPPDHKMVDVTIETHALDDSRLPVMVSVDQIASTANPDRDKNGNIIPDSAVVDIDQSTGIIYLQLRSERPGKGPARVYTVTIRGTDTSGNSTTADIKIQVPHDKGK